MAWTYENKSMGVLYHFSTTEEAADWVSRHWLDGLIAPEDMRHISIVFEEYLGVEYMLFELLEDIKTSGLDIDEWMRAKLKSFIIDDINFFDPDEVTDWNRILKKVE